jgi:uncharacterized C2H2 Zn-finger protein
MVKYECNRCHKTFNLKGNYTKHIERKNPCKERPMPELPSYVCNRCHKIFNRKSNYDRHMKRKNPCKEKENPDQPNYVCVRCKKEFERKGDYDRHLKRKNECKEVKQQTEEKIKCQFCGKEFETQFGVSMHIQNKVCNQMKQMIILFDDNKRITEQDKQLIEENKRIAEENNRLKEELKVLQLQSQEKNINSNNNTTNSNNSTTNSNNTNNITFNITNRIVAFGSEDISKIKEDDDVKHILKFRPNQVGINELTRLIHFNEKFPENHNIFLNDPEKTHIQIYDGKQWETTKTKEAYECIKKRVSDSMEEILDDWKKNGTLEYLTEHKHISYISDLGSEIGRLYRQELDDKLIDIMYKNRGMVEKTKNAQEQMMLQQS